MIKKQLGGWGSEILLKQLKKGIRDREKKTHLFCFQPCQEKRPLRKRGKTTGSKYTDPGRVGKEDGKISKR